MKLKREFKMIKFPSINQYRNVVHHVKNSTYFVGLDEDGSPIYDKNRKLPTLKFRGTVKLHGTNAAVVYDIDEKTFSFQSRTRVLDLSSDNANFALYMSSKTEVLEEIMSKFTTESSDKKIAVYGEWCGSSIQKGVALNQLNKMFVVFAIKIIGEDPEEYRWLDVANFTNVIDYPNDNIYNIVNFGTWEIDIDFNNPELSQNKMVDITLDVEKECPVGKHFGVSGIGEGVVWTCLDDNFNFDSGTWMKVKGDKHSSSKVKKLASVDVEAIESMNKFVESVVTESRLEQGLDHLINEMQKPFEMTSIGDFIRWIYNDVIKEETDTIIANQLDPKKLGGPLAKASKAWYIDKLNGEIT